MSFDEKIARPLILEKGGAMKKIIVFSIISLILYAFPTSSLSDMIWEVEKIVDDFSISDDTTSIALDKNNNPGISYQDHLGERFLRYAYKNSDGTWHYTTVDPTRNCGVSSNDLQRNPLTGFPEISYVCSDPDPHILKFAQFDGTLWNTNTIPLTGAFAITNNPCCVTSLAYHPTTNFPAIIYKNSSRIGFVEYNGASWVGGEQFELFFSSSSFDLEYISNGNPLISYMDRTGLFVAERVNGEWKISTVDNTPGISLNHSKHGLDLEFDSNGIPHIAYISAESFLRYASFNGISWDIEDSRFQCRRVYFDFDAHDNPFFACDQNEAIYLGHKEGNNWVFDLITEPFAASMSNIVVDDLGNAHLSFIWDDVVWYDVADPPRDLYYANGIPIYNPFPWILFYPALIRSSR